MSKEFDNYKYLLENIKDPALRTRVSLSLEYYIDKANNYKLYWNVLSILGIVLPVAATFLICLGAPPMTTAFITALATVAAALLPLLKCAEKKDAYRNTAERLKSELSLYASRRESYKGIDPDGVLYPNVEKILQAGYDKIPDTEKRV